VLVAINSFKAIPVPKAGKVPPAGNPISIGLVAGDPDIPRSRAGRNIGHRSARINPKFGRLGRRRSQAQSASYHRCTQHPIPHAAHKPSVPAGAPASSGRPGFPAVEVCLLLPLRRAGYVLFQQWFRAKVASKDRK
jgi:hypothetical protein